MSIELKILDFIQTLHTPVLDKIMVGITRLGDAGIIWIILTAIFLVIPKTRRTGGVMLAALVVASQGQLPPVKRHRQDDIHTREESGGKQFRAYDLTEPTCQTGELPVFEVVHELRQLRVARIE